MNWDRFKFRVWDNDFGEYIDEGALLNGSTGKISGTGNYTIEQCTGIRDKNGKLIYEGDVVCYDDTPYSAYARKVTGPVVWCKASFCIHRHECIGDSYIHIAWNDDFWSRKTEIIGNIHEEEQKDEH